MNQNDCPICRHVERSLIDNAIAEGRPDSFFANNFAADAESIQWHREHCLGYTGGGTGEGLSARDWRANQCEQLRVLRERAGEIISKATGGELQDLRAALTAISAASRLIAQEGRLADRKAAPRVKLASTPEWQRLKARIIRALEPFPDAHAALVEALRHD